MIKNQTDTTAIPKEKGDAAQLTLATLVAKSNKIKELGKTLDKLTNSQLRTLLVALKRTGNRALPTLKKDVLLWLME